MNVLVYIAGETGRRTLNGLYAASKVCELMVATVNWVMLKPLAGKGLRVRSAIAHYTEFGVRSLPIVSLICFLIGAIMAMQSAYQLARYGAQHLVADLVGVAALRELAPLMTAILLTGRSGSAITAEIGTMKVGEEIDALEVMGLNPVKFLVAPKFLAMLFAVPCLTVLAMLSMILGGFMVATGFIGMDPALYLANTADALKGKDFATGMIKSVFFAVTICWVGVYRGFQVEGGAEGVGRKTTSSVVTSIFMIIVVDLVFTTLFYFNEP